MNKVYQYSVDTFKKINPSKKFLSFTYFEIKSLNDVRLYMEKNMVVEFEGEYFIYSGSKTYTSPCCFAPMSRIEVKSGRKVLHTVII